MSDISELERRISYALERISTASSRLHAGGAEDLSAALAAEREANAQLEARVAAIKERQETQVTALEAEAKELRAALAEKDGQLQRMREVNATLRSSNTALREANAEGLADAGLVNAAMSAEIDALRALTDESRAEIDAVLAQIEPLIEGGSNA
jgi:chromosome segregation ATPase